MNPIQYSNQICYKPTNKLFFKKYVYKVAIKTPLASYFRNKDLDWITERIRGNILAIETGKLKTITVRSYWQNAYVYLDDLVLGQDLVSLLQTFEDFCCRIEGEILGLYFNNELYLERILENNSITISEICRPTDDRTRNFLLSNPGSIIRKEYTHKYKVTVNSLKKEEENFRAWAEKIPKIKLSSSSFRVEGHFYVADKKTLDLCRLFLNDRIRKIEEIFTANEF